jgi:hypothetical protein
MPLSEPATGNDWPRLERDVGRLFSAAPLYAVGSLGNGPQEELYLGRAAEVRLMVQAVHDPAKHILLYGERGIGKTSLANAFWRQSNTSNYPLLAARIQVNSFDNFSSLWSRALKEFEAVFRHYNPELCSTYEYVSPDVVRREFQKLPRHLGAIMIVDEFDLLRDTEARELTANLLKSLHDHASSVTILLIGVAENVEELLINHRSLRRVLSPIKLKRFNIGDLEGIFDSRLRSTSLKISMEARSEIVTISCGMPYFLQIMGKMAAQSAIEYRRLQVQVKDVSSAIESFLAENGQTFSGDYRRATENRFASNVFRDVILASALTFAGSSDGFESSDVSKILNVIARERGYHHSRVQQRLAEFISNRRGKILTRSWAHAGYRYCFTDALMQPFIVMKAIKDGVIDEELRHLMLHSVKAEDCDSEYQIEVAEADPRRFETNDPAVTDEAGGETPNISEAEQSRSELSRVAPGATILAGTPFDRRLSPRRRVLEVAVIVFRYSTMDCVIHDTSDTGALLRPRDIVGCPTKFVLKPTVDPSRDCEVVWRKDEVLGVCYL